MISHEPNINAGGDRVFKIGKDAKNNSVLTERDNRPL